MIDSLDTSEADALPWVKPTQPAPGEEGAPTLTKEETALGAFLAAMHDSNLDGGKMREAMLNVLGLTATHQPAAIDTEQAKGLEAVAVAQVIQRGPDDATLVIEPLGDFPPEGTLLGIVEPAKQQREVAWGAFYSGGKHNGKLYAHCDTKEQIKQYIADRHRSDDYNTFTSGPLYTTPPAQPAREWVGLGACADFPAKSAPEFLAGAYWAEAKLREKNGGAA